MNRPGAAYLFDQGWERERARLSGLSAGFDTVTIRLLEDLGVGPGWSCCEVGAGAGSIARWLAGRVSPHGWVMVTDLDTRFLSDLAGLPGVEVRQADVTSDPLPPDTFDLIHARAVLEHLPDREQVISALAAGLRPGGVVLVEDTVIGGDFGRAAEPMVHPRRLAEAFIRVVEAVSAGFRAVGADPRFGPRLPGLLNDTGLTRVGAAFVSRLVTGGSPESEFYTFTLAELSERLVAAGVLDAADADLIGEMTLDPDSQWPSLGMVSAWGYRK